MLAIERVVVLLATHAIVEAEVRSRKGPWLIDLGYRHITATLVFNGEYSAENPLGGGAPGGLLEGTCLWCVPGGTAVEIASFLAGWMIGRADTPPKPSPAGHRPGPDHDDAARTPDGNLPRATEGFSPSAFLEGQRRARSGPDGWTG
jgi:hypothetical protein